MHKDSTTCFVQTFFLPLEKLLSVHSSYVPSLVFSLYINKMIRRRLHYFKIFKSSSIFVFLKIYL